MSEENTNWADALPEQMRTLTEVERAKSLDSFIENMKTTREYVSNAIRVPTENAGEADMQAFYEKLQKHAPNLMPTPDMSNPDSVTEALKRMGLPDDMKGYEDIEGDAVAFVEGQFDTLKQWAHEAGLTRAQFQKLGQLIGADTYTQQSERDSALKEQMGKVSEEWGLSAEAKFKETLDFAKASDAPQAMIDALENRQIDAATVFWLNQMAANMSENAEASGQDTRVNSNTLTPYEAQQQIREIQMNRDHPYYNGDPKAQERMHELMRMANPERYKDAG
ncbi:MAG: hypothetical protein KAJ55_07760 [Anaerolineales bacterium]|nr:hypothetical protein [Anaerolineales bacterium]